MKKKGPRPGAARLRKRVAQSSTPQDEFAPNKSDIIQTVSAPTGRRGSDLSNRKLTLRLKIVITMALLVLLTSLIMSGFVYNESVSQLNQEIDSKGARLIQTLQSVDPAYWYYCFKFGGLSGASKERSDRRMEILEYLFKNHPRGDGWQTKINNQPPLKSLRDNITASASPKTAAQLNELFVSVCGEKWEIDIKDDSLWKTYYRFLHESLGDISPLQKLSRNTEDIEIVSIAISSKKESITSAGNQSIKIWKNTITRKVGGVEVFDGNAQGVVAHTRIPVRSFLLEEKTPMGGLQYNVLLSMQRINNAKGDLQFSIFLPVFLTGLLALGIAYWVSSLITNPLRRLMTDINQVSSGDLHHQTIANSKDEIGQLAQTFNRMTQALRAAREQELEQKALEHELNIANEIQSNLLPKRMLKIPGFDVGAYYRPSKEVGGDYYDFVSIDDDNVGIIVADVSGKGVPGSLVMSMARAFIRMEAQRTHNVSPMDSLIRCNHMLAQDIKKGMFVTAIYGILNIPTRTLRVSSAGHNPMLLWRASENKTLLVNPAGIALGFDRGPVFEKTIREESIVLQPKDRIVMYTDGAVETMNEANEEFGDQKFYELCQKLALRESNEFINIAVRALDEHQGAGPQHDDITLVTLRVT